MVVHMSKYKANKDTVSYSWWAATHKQKSDIKMQGSSAEPALVKTITRSADVECVTSESDISAASMYDEYTVNTLLSYRRLIMCHAYSLLWW